MNAKYIEILPHAFAFSLFVNSLFLTLLTGLQFTLFGALECTPLTEILPTLRSLFVIHL